MKNLLIFSHVNNRHGCSQKQRSRSLTTHRQTFELFDPRDYRVLVHFFSVIHILLLQVGFNWQDNIFDQRFFQSKLLPSHREWMSIVLERPNVQVTAMDTHSWTREP